MSKNKYFKTFLLTLLFMCGLLFISGQANATSKVLYPETTTPKDDCIFLGVCGSYEANQASALKRINEIRWEACHEGICGLTMADYHPVKWSSEIEKYARLRAAESSVTVNHTSTSGRSAIGYQEGMSCFLSYECLGFNTGIEGWYSEKVNLITGNGGITGHYLAMIDPDIKYIGMATFNCLIEPDTQQNLPYNTAYCYIATADDIEMDQNYLPAETNCLQLLNVLKSYIAGNIVLEGRIVAPDIYEEYGGWHFSVQMPVKIGDKQVNLFVPDGKITSPNSSISVQNSATFDVIKKVTTSRCESFTLNYTGAGQSASKTFEHSHTYKIKVIKKACGEDGYSEKTCYYCGYKTTSVEKKSREHKFSSWATKTNATLFTAGVKARTCKYCDKEETQAIKTLSLKYTVKKGKKKTIKIQVPSGDTIKSIKSLNKKILVANNKGVVKGKKKGTAKILVTLASGKKATIKVSVK